jgi:hypothetical protein
VPIRLAAALGLVAVAGCLLLVGLLHVLGGLDPLRMTLSEYALGPLGWMFDAGVTGLAAGSVLVLFALVSAGSLRWPSAGAVALLVWAGALLVLVMFQKADWSVGPSLSGYVHRYAGFAAFVALPAAALAVGRCGTGRFAARLRVLAVLAYGWLAVIVAGMLLYPLAGVPMWQVVPLGLVERGLALTEVAALALLAATAYRAAPSPAPSPHTALRSHSAVSDARKLHYGSEVRTGRGGATGEWEWEGEGVSAR